MRDPDTEITEDLFLNGRLRLRQPKRGHRAGHDAILLAAATPARAADRVLDFGAGVGTAGLALARRVPGIDLVLIELDARLVALARANAELNGVDAKVVALDIGAGAQIFAAEGIGPDTADVVLMNPPFNDALRHRPSPDVGRQAAHMATEDTLQTWVRAAHRVLKSQGVLSLIWRADGLSGVLTALERGFGSVEILPVSPNPDAPAIRILVKAVKSGRAALLIYPALALNQETGKPGEKAQAILGGDGGLILAEVPEGGFQPKK